MDFLNDIYLSPGDAGGIPEKEQAADDSQESSPPEAERKYTDTDIEKLKAEYELKITQAADEAAKKAAMKPDEQAEYEKDKRFKELERKEAELNAKQLKLDALDLLTESNLDKDFLPFVMGSDLEDTKTRAEAFKKLFDAKLHEKHIASFAGKTPPANTGGGVNSEREQIRKAMGV